MTARVTRESGRLSSEASRQDQAPGGAVPPPSVGGARPSAGFADRLLPDSRTRRRPRALVVVAGEGRPSESAAVALASSLHEFGVEAVYLGREDRSDRIVLAVEAEGAQTIELCLGGFGGVKLIRDLLRHLAAIGRRDVSIVIHRM